MESKLWQNSCNTNNMAVCQVKKQYNICFPQNYTEGYFETFVGVVTTSGGFNAG